MTCPLPQQLQQLIDETLPDEQQPALQAHLETCPVCQQKVEQLAAGGVTWDKAAHNLGDQPNPTETALIDAVEKLQDTPTSAINTQAEHVAGPIDEDLSFLQPSQKPNSIGRLDNYEILSVIGKGGFGIVLKGFDEELHRVVAIKVLLPHFAANGAARERFRREAKAAAAIMHENVVAIHAVSQREAKAPYLVMQFISGQTLAEKIDKAGPLGVKEILRIGMQIAEGLAAANKHEGLVHRDIKPANILLENGVERVKISDFGLARAADDASVTQSGTIAGTPMYMSPEQANGEVLDHRSDLFSLGSVLYVMCTGRPPFRATSTMAVMKRVCDDTPTPVQEVNADIPDWLADIITKLHAKKPADRFQTAKEVAELLGQRLADVQAGRAIERAPIERASHVSGGSVPLPPPANAGGSPPASPQPIGWIGPVCLGLIMTAGFAGATAQVLNSAAQSWPHVAPLLLFGVGGVAFLGVAIPVALGVEWVVRIRRGALTRSKAFAFGFVGTQLVVGGIGFLLNYKSPIDRDPYTPTFGGPGWRKLYDGKTLAGWKTFGDAKASDGEIILPGDLPGSSVESIDRLPRNFHLALGVKVERGGLTVRFHTQPREKQANDNVPKDGWFLDFSGLEKEGEVTATLRLLDGGRQETRHAGGIAKPGDWFHLEIIAKDDSTEVLINGKSLIEILEFRTGKHGPIALVPANTFLSLRHVGKKDAQAAIRNIEVKDLTQASGQLVVEVREPGAVRLEIFQTGKPETKQDFPYEERVGLRFDQNLPFGEWNVVAYYRKLTDPPFRAKFDLAGKPQWIIVPMFDAPVPKQPTAEAKFVPLFDGKDFAGWTGDVTNWRISDGFLGPKAAADEGASEIFTTKAFENYELRLEYFLNDVGNKGGGALLFHSDGKAKGACFRLDLHPKGGDFLLFSPRGGLELPNQMGGGIGVKKNDWNELRIVSKDGNIDAFVNGMLRAGAIRCMPPKGFIGLSPVTIVNRFRKIEIKELPLAEPAWVPLFNGKDLTGWVPVSREKEPDPKSAFHVDGNVLMVEGRKGYSMLRTEKAYENYELEFEFRVPPLQREKAGCLLFLHLQPNFTTGNLLSIYPDGQGNLTDSNRKDFEFKIKGKPPRDGGWSHVHLTCRGHEVGIRLNGEDLGIAKFKDAEIRKGFVAIWPESIEVHYRNLRLRELPAKEAGWVPLFNGKNLTGWKTPHAEKSDWKVEGAELVGRSAPDSYLFSDAGHYQDFHLRAEVKLNAVGNSGVFLRTRFADFSADSVAGYEADLTFVEGTPSSPVGTLWKDGKRVQRALKSTAKPDQWFTLEVIARGARLQVLVNGQTAADYTDATDLFRKGHIALQAIEENTVVRFRKIEIKELPPTASK